MPLTPRKKTALGLFISGLAFVALAIVFWFTLETPYVVTVIFAGLGWLAQTIGLAVTLPQVT